MADVCDLEISRGDGITSRGVKPNIVCQRPHSASWSLWWSPEQHYYPKSMREKREVVDILRPKAVQSCLCFSLTPR